MSSIDTSYSSPTVSAINHTTENIASGEEVNSASENPAALSIAAQMLSQLQEINQGERNLNDGISLTQVADESLENGSELIQRMRELAEQAANGIYNDSNRTALQQEMGQLQNQFNDIIQNTTFNGQQLLNQDSTINIQAGEDAFGIQTTDLSNQLAPLFTLDISTQQGATSAIGALDQSLSVVTENRAEFGATQNRLESRLEVAREQNLNTVDARSRIIDTDYAKATAERSREQILQSAEVAMHTHANTSRTDVLQLLGV